MIPRKASCLRNFIPGNCTGESSAAKSRSNAFDVTGETSKAVVVGSTGDSLTSGATDVSSDGFSTSFMVTVVSIADVD